MHDIAEFLRRHPPFEELDAGTLESLARRRREFLDLGRVMSNFIVVDAGRSRSTQDTSVRGRSLNQSAGHGGRLMEDTR